MVPPKKRLRRPRGWVRPAFASWAHGTCNCCGPDPCDICSVPSSITVTIASHTFPACCKVTGQSSGGDFLSVTARLAVDGAANFNGSFSLSNISNCVWCYHESNVFSWELHGDAACTTGGGSYNANIVVKATVEQSGANRYWHVQAYAYGELNATSGNWAFVYFDGRTPNEADCADLNGASTTSNDTDVCLGTGGPELTNCSGTLDAQGYGYMNNGNGTATVSY